MIARRSLFDLMKPAFWGTKKETERVIDPVAIVLFPLLCATGSFPHGNEVNYWQLRQTTWLLGPLGLDWSEYDTNRTRKA